MGQWAKAKHSVGKTVRNSKTGHNSQIKYSGRKTTQAQTTQQRTWLPTRTHIWTPHIRWNNSREKATRTKKHQKKSRLAKPMLSDRGQRPIRGQYPLGRGRYKNKKPHLPVFGQEATNIFHQRNPHHQMSKCTTDAFVEQLKETFKELRNQTFDRYCKLQTKTLRNIWEIPLKNKAKNCNLQLGRFRRQPREKQLHSRHAQPTNPNGPVIRRPWPNRNITVLRARDQENQQKLAKTNRSPRDTCPQGQPEVQYIRRNNSQQRQSIPQRTGILQTPRSGQIPDCWKCG